VDLVLGTYDRSGLPPATGDAFVGTVSRTASPNGSASHIWVNTPPLEGCTLGTETGVALRFVAGIV
jgi:hypothetical protein